MSVVSWKGVKYRLQRCLGMTAYDRKQRRRARRRNLSVDEDLIVSLNIAPLFDLPLRISARIAYLVCSILIVAMGLFLYQSFSTARDEKFLALSSSAGICNTVPKTVSGIYKFDVFGNWEGSENFQVTKSIYHLTLNRIEYTEAEFAALVDIGLQQINRYAAMSFNRTLSDNLVFWTTWSVNTVASANKQHLRMTGDARTLYNQGTTHLSGMTSLSGRCGISPTVTYDKASGLYRLIYSYNEFSSSEACMKVANPSSLDFDPELGVDDFILEFDVQALLTAMGVNYGIIDHEVLEEIPHTRAEISLETGQQSYAQYYNPRYPNMNPITCFRRHNGSEDFDYDRIAVCSVEIGDTPFYPVLNHIGYTKQGFNETLFCSCTEEVLSNSQFSHQCNSFLLVTGLLFYHSDPHTGNANSVPMSLEYLSKLLTKYEGDARKLELNADAYNASKDAIHFLDDGYFNNSQREEYFDFCTIDNISCSVLTFYSSSSTRYRYGISEDYYQITHGHCNDSLSVSLEAQSLMDFSPTPLTENYLECRRTLTDTILTSIGIAVGNVLSVKSALVIFFTFWLARYTKPDPVGSKSNKGHGVKRFFTYGTVERNKVLQYLAFNLLLARDGKYGQESSASEPDVGSSSFDSEGSFILGLAKELEKYPGLKRFFPTDRERNQSVNRLSPLHNKSEDGFEMSSFQTSTDARKQNLTEQNTSQKEYYDEILHNPMFTKTLDKEVDK